MGTRCFENPSSLPASPPGSGVGAVYIVKMDTPADGMYGIIARMPRVAGPDAYLYDSGSLDAYGSTTIVTPPKAYGKNNRMAQKGGVTVGSVGNTKRGYYNLTIKTEDFVSGGENILSEVCTKHSGCVTLTGTPYKVLQPYLFKESQTGRLYLVVVASSYTSGAAYCSDKPLSRGRCCRCL